MKMNAYLFAAIAVMLVSMAGFAHAQATSEPALQISSYSTVPAIIYPGSTGQLQLLISNAGGDTATSVTIFYDNGPDGNSASTNTGDISVGTSTLASVPFGVPNATTSGILIIHLNILYKDAVGNSKTTPLTVSIPISQHQVLDVKTLQSEGGAIGPGDTFTLKLGFANTGGVVRNVVIRTPDNSSFTLNGASQQTIGDVASGQTGEADVQMVASSMANPGKYSVPLIVQYQDAIGNIVSQNVYVGPVSISDASTQFDVEMKPLTPTEIGSQVQFKLTVENRGTGTVSAAIDFNQSDIFTPIGSNRVYMDGIAPGSNGTQVVTFGISPSASAGYYTLPVYITSNGRTFSQDIGIAVQATQEVTLTSSTSPSFATGGSSVTVSADISNTGNSPIRSVYAEASAPKGLGISGTNNKFIGTLNVDDFTTFQFTLNVPPQAQAGNYTIPVKITFKDSVNQEHNVTRNVELTVYSGADAARFGAAELASGTNSTRFGRQSSGFFGISLLTPINIGIAIVVLVAGYFAYKKFWGAKK